MTEILKQRRTEFTPVRADATCYRTNGPVLP